MELFTTIQASIQGSTGTVTMNRPGLHQAMNIEMIRELSLVLEKFGAEGKVRVVVLKSSGENFSAGADLHWMQKGMDQSREQLTAESMELAGLFRLISTIEPVVICSVSGKVIAGANGLVAASDLVIADSTALFRIPEVKLGLVPATIAPYILRRTGFGKASAWMLTGRAFDTNEAMEAGLVDYSCEKGKLEQETTTLVHEILSGGPEAVKGIKKMLRYFHTIKDPELLQKESAAMIASFRISPEGQEGMKAFFEKRRPIWDVDNALP